MLPLFRAYVTISSLQTGRTCIGNHRPPFGAAMPLALRSAAIAATRAASLHAALDVRAQGLSLLGRLRSVDLGLLWIAELEADWRGQRLACALADHVARARRQW